MVTVFPKIRLLSYGTYVKFEFSRHFAESLQREILEETTGALEFEYKLCACMIPSIALFMLQKY